MESVSKGALRARKSMSSACLSLIHFSEAPIGGKSDKKCGAAVMRGTCKRKRPCSKRSFYRLRMHEASVEGL